MECTFCITDPSVTGCPHPKQKGLSCLREEGHEGEHLVQRGDGKHVAFRLAEDGSVVGQYITTTLADMLLASTEFTLP